MVRDLRWIRWEHVHDQNPARTQEQDQAAGISTSAGAS
jgi:hypothetical protein